MKLSLILEDEAWFWVCSETGMWEAWYEVGDTPAVRLPKLDRTDVFIVAALIAEMSFSAQQEFVIH